MNYLKKTRAELEEMLSDLPDDKVKGIIKYFNGKVLESYKNGIKKAEGKKPSDNVSSKE